MNINDLDKKIKFNQQSIYRLIAREVGLNINGLSEPCYVVHTQNFEKCFLIKIIYIKVKEDARSRLS
ncbi:unnamed protein product [marine sediment metagenome]|uniref:Uncharacterized protein n=1 Tax=marine sediment metagenome TaxID=412755 RepID=X1CB16_9ZZZZ